MWCSSGNRARLQCMSRRSTSKLLLLGVIVGTCLQVLQLAFAPPAQKEIVTGVSQSLLARRQLLLSGLAASVGAPAVIQAFMLPEPSHDDDQVVVLGGSGFLGSRICELLVDRGAAVTSISRSGGPPAGAGPWADKVRWVVGDITDMDLEKQFQDKSAVVSAVGAIGSESDESNSVIVNEVAVDAARTSQVPRFVVFHPTPSEGPNSDFVARVFPENVGPKAADTEIDYPGQAMILNPTLVPIQKEVKKIESAFLIDSNMDDVAKAAVAGAFGSASGIYSGDDGIKKAASLL